MSRRLPAFRSAAALLTVLLLVTAALGACGPIPRPFGQDAETKSHNPFLFIQESTGIFVEPVKGPVDWVGAAMAKAMAEALVERNVVASDRARNRSSYVLSSQGYQELQTDGAPELVLEWVLRDPAGKVIGQKTVTSVPPENFWDTPVTEDFQEIAQQNAPDVSAWLLPELTADRDANLPPLMVDLIAGAGGSGNAILRQTLLLKLRSRGVEIVESGVIPEGALRLSGRIDIRPLDGNRDLVQISWRLADAGTREIGVVDQSNAVPAGTMEESWLGAAPDITDGALEGLLPLLRAYERHLVGGKAVTFRQ